MSVYHCPLCPLIFNYRTEVEWHLREEHRSRSDEEADLRAELSSATEPLDWGRLRELRSSKGSPSVSLLISTAPAAAMTVLDIARLRQLADRARRRLPAEPGRDTPTSVVEHRLSHAVALAETLPTDRGVAVLVNPHHIAIHTLPFAPRDRHVVDAGFATRDLEYALRRHPRYRVLVLGHHPRILEGHGSQLASADDQPNTARPSTVDRSAAGPVSGCSCAELDALLDRRVEQAGPLPLVIVGERRHLEDFPRHSRHAGQVIAQVVRPPLRRASPADLAVQAVERWLAEQQQQSVAELHDAARADRVVWGVEAAWGALHSRGADRLWAEHDFAVPGRTVPGVYGVETTTDPAEPGVTDDLVDALITQADRLGVPVTLLDRGVLAHPEPVAASIRASAFSAAPTPTPSLAVA
jgi:hypothetical protein